MRTKYMPLALAAALALTAATPVQAASTDAAYEAAQNMPAEQASQPGGRSHRRAVSQQAQPAQQKSVVEVKADKSAKTEYSADSYVEDESVFKTATLRREATAPDYRLFKGDAVSVLVVGFPDGIGLNGFTVGIDGYVQLPYVGSVKMEGKTLDEAKEIIMSSLGQYIKIPDMSLQITNYGPRKVYVMGEVKTPGIVNLGIDNMNAYAALAGAGGWTVDGRSTQVQIMRVRDGIMYWRKLDMKSYAKRHDLTQNVVVEEGDMIYVPKSNGIKWQRDILPWFNAWSLYKGLTD
ncbi:MAG: polysaccharide export protein [Selenomonadaceae bacterium]|nr:polysaccharide export protein [Selenomonadaceae bacterium]